ncbi:MAG: hypothetical protein R2875_10805 [Desulfobacterales bacterium]
MIEELEASIKKFEFFKYIVIADDDFFMRPLDQIEDFSRQYKEKLDCLLALPLVQIPIIQKNAIACGRRFVVYPDGNTDRQSASA